MNIFTRLSVWNTYRKNKYLTLQQAMELPNSEPLWVIAKFGIKPKHAVINQPLTTIIRCDESWTSTPPATEEPPAPRIQNAELLLSIPHFKHVIDCNNNDERIHKVRNESIKIECSAMPQELTQFMDRKRILESSDFRRFYGSMMLEILSPSEARKLRATDEAQQARIEKDKRIAAEKEAGARVRVVSM